MNGLKKTAYKALKYAVDRETHADGNLSSKCLYILYQPKRNVKKTKSSKSEK